MGGPRGAGSCERARRSARVRMGTRQGDDGPDLVDSPDVLVVALVHEEVRLSDAQRYFAELSTPERRAALQLRLALRARPDGRTRRGGSHGGARCRPGGHRIEREQLVVCGVRCRRRWLLRRGLAVGPLDLIDAVEDETAGEAREQRQRAKQLKEARTLHSPACSRHCLRRQDPPR